MDTLETSFRRETTNGLRVAMIARLAALGAVALWMTTRLGFVQSLFYLVVIALLALVGILQWRVSLAHGSWRRFAQALLILLDAALIACVLLLAEPSSDWPQAMQLRLGNFAFFFLIIALAALTYSPLLAFWTGTAIALCWIAGVFWLLGHGDSYTITDLGALQALDRASLRDLLLDPTYVSLVIVGQETFVAVLVAAIIALAVARARRLAIREAAAASERANLARYFSPEIAREIARNPGSLSETRNGRASILFVDIKGFTRLAEALPPDRTIALLRRFHQLCGAAIFAHGGTLNKFLGDGLMATFGTPREAPDDAIRGLRAALAIGAAVVAWNEERARVGEDEIRIAMGLHHGSVLLGNIGDSQCLEFAVLGDAVNVAARLETLTREYDTDLLVSASALDAARAAAPEDASLDAFEDLETRPLEGREGWVQLYARSDFA